MKLYAHLIFPSGLYLSHSSMGITLRRITRWVLRQQKEGSSRVDKNSDNGIISIVGMKKANE